MTGLLKTTEQWAGLCRKQPVVNGIQACTDISLPLKDGLAGGGCGGSGSIRRGISAALCGMMILKRNRSLLWFTLLGGLVLAGNCIYQAAISYLGWNLHMHIDVNLLYALDFFIEFASLFCLVFLLAGLILSISSRKKGPASFSEGIYRAKKYLKPIIFWSFLLTIAGILLIRIYIDVPIALFPHELGFVQAYWPGIVICTLAQFPFNLTLDWNMLTEFPGYGGRSLLLWIYPFGFTSILIPLSINLLLFILTPFVMPLIVLEHKTLRSAIRESVTMMKKSWIEMVTCTIFIGVVACSVFLTYLLVQAISGMVSPYETVTFHPSGTWIVLGFFYDLALFIFALIMVTIGGIGAFNLYSSTKSRQVAGYL